MVADLPELAQRHLEKQDIKSLIAVPIFVGEAWWGVIGFDDCRSARQWSSVETEALRAAARTLGAALQRKQADETLRKANELVSAVVEASPVAITALDAQGLVRMWNPAAEKLFGWTEGIVPRGENTVPRAVLICARRALSHRDPVVLHQHILDIARTVQASARPTARAGRLDQGNAVVVVAHDVTCDDQRIRGAHRARLAQLMPAFEAQPCRLPPPGEDGIPLSVIVLSMMVAL